MDLARRWARGRPVVYVAGNHEFHLVMDVIDRVPGLRSRAADLRQHMVDERLRHRADTREQVRIRPSCMGGRGLRADLLAGSADA